MQLFCHNNKTLSNIASGDRYSCGLIGLSTWSKSSLTELRSEYCHSQFKTLIETTKRNNFTDHKECLNICCFFKHRKQAYCKKKVEHNYIFNYISIGPSVIQFELLPKTIWFHPSCFKMLDCLSLYCVTTQFIYFSVLPKPCKLHFVDPQDAFSKCRGFILMHFDKKQSLLFNTSSFRLTIQLKILTNICDVVLSLVETRWTRSG